MKYSSPLRYPGGKQKLAPFVAEIIKANKLWGCNYVEPYAGGAGVAIDLLFSGAAEKIHLNDACPAIHAFWSCVLDDVELLCRRISRAWLDVREWRTQKEVLSRPAEFSVADLGFATFYLNRVNRSGILSGGVIGGIEQHGKWKIDARFRKEGLIRRIEAINTRRSDITLHGLDAEKYFELHIPTLPKKTLIYCDPPYFRKAERLYLNHYLPADHEKIARTIQRSRKKWLVSYDSAPEIIALYNKRRHFIYDLQYNAGKAYKGKEVFVFSDSLTIPSASVLETVDLALRQM